MPIRSRNFYFALSLPLLLLSWLFPTWQARVDPALLTSAAASPVEFIVYLSEQADLSPAARLSTKIEKTRFVYQALSNAAHRTQAPLIQFLASRRVEFRPFWIVNAIWVRGDSQLVQTLARRSDVAHIYANPWVHLDLPEPPPATENALSASGIEWNVATVHAPEAWALGYNGQGVVIGGQDTGYDWTHPGLIRQYRGWDGTSASHDYNWYDAIHEGSSSCGIDSPVPCDDYGHGTHTLGTMLGDDSAVIGDGSGRQVGVAPGARWIGCRNMRNGVGSPASYTECYEWFVAPTDLNGKEARPELAPDVINNSWSCTASEGCTEPEILLEVVKNVRAAGILTVHSAGNSGASCSTINQPAAIYEDSFTVGATDVNDAIASFSSRGPVTVDGSNRLKPNVTAPGAGIVSTTPGGSYGSSSGTSMAAPHVAGITALILSAQPSLAGNIDALEALLQSSAIPLQTNETCGGTNGQVPNNTYGWGRVDAFAAIQSLLFTHKIFVPALFH